MELHSGASSDDCARCGDTSSSRSLWPWPRLRTTPLHGDRRRPGLGKRYELKHTVKFWKHVSPSQSSSACSTKSPAGGGLSAWQSLPGRKSYTHSLAGREPNLTNSELVEVWSDTENSVGVQAGYGPISSIPPMRAACLLARARQIRFEFPTSRLRKSR